MKVAILSNSYGEDRSGALIGLEMKKLNPEIELESFPLVSFGEEYKKRGIKVIGGSAPPPSGGFLLKSINGLVKDLVQSLHLPFKYTRILQKKREEFDLIIIVGDVPLLILGWVGFRKKSYFLAPCKSDLMAPHFWIERQIINRFVKTIFTHDELTSSNLRKNGIDALFLGNPMMDDLIPENRYNPPEEKILIGILPGSREEAYRNIYRVIEVILTLKKRRKDIHFTVSVADTLNFNRIEKAFLNLEDEVDLVKGAFVDILKNSKLVISLSGTATEQAAGLGVPVVSFVGTGAQTTKRRLLGQRKLLGESFRLLNYNPEKIAYEIDEILIDENQREVMGKAGEERMGPPGGAKNIAKYILKSEGIL